MTTIRSQLKRLYKDVQNEIDVHSVYQEIYPYGSHDIKERYINVATALEEALRILDAPPEGTNSFDNETQPSAGSIVVNVTPKENTDAWVPRRRRH